MPVFSIKKLHSGQGTGVLYLYSFYCVCVCVSADENKLHLNTIFAATHDAVAQWTQRWLIAKCDTAKWIISHSTRILQQYCNLHWRMTFAADEWMGITFLPQCALDKRRKLDYLYTTRFARTIRDDMPTLWWPCMPSRFQFCSVFLLYMFFFFFFFLLIVNNWNWILIRQPLINQSINEVSVIQGNYISLYRMFGVGWSSWFIDWIWIYFNYVQNYKV